MFFQKYILKKDLPGLMAGTEFHKDGSILCNEHTECLSVPSWWLLQEEWFERQ